MAARAPLVLIPGVLLDADLWRHQCDALDDVAQIHVADVATRDSLAGMADDILATMPPRFAVAALSMGGTVAFELLRRAPQRISRLALLDTHARADDEATVARRHELMDLAAGGRFDAVTRRLLGLLLHPDRLTDAALVAAVTAMAERLGPAVFLRQQRALLARPDSRELLPGIACPTLVLCGRQDALTPLPLNREMAEAIPGARLETIEACGHLPPLERPAETSAALRRWLTGGNGPGAACD